MNRKFWSVIGTAVLLAAGPAVLSAADYGKKDQETKKEEKVEATTRTETRVEGARQETTGSLNAVLVEPQKKAKERAATVEVKVQGVEIVDAAKTGERPSPGQAHVHYRLDGGPIIATTATKLSFHDLNAGRHVISVWLAANDHTALTPETKLEVNVPSP